MLPREIDMRRDGRENTKGTVWRVPLMMLIVVIELREEAVNGYTANEAVFLSRFSVDAPHL